MQISRAPACADCSDALEYELRNVRVVWEVLHSVSKHIPDARVQGTLLRAAVGAAAHVRDRSASLLLHGLIS